MNHILLLTCNSSAASWGYVPLLLNKEVLTLTHPVMNNCNHAGFFFLKGNYTAQWDEWEIGWTLLKIKLVQMCLAKCVQLFWPDIRHNLVLHFSFFFLVVVIQPSLVERAWSHCATVCVICLNLHSSRIQMLNRKRKKKEDVPIWNGELKNI